MKTFHNRFSDTNSVCMLKYFSKSLVEFTLKKELNLKTRLTSHVYIDIEHDLSIRKGEYIHI
jgi:hypothetical protein